MYINDYSLFASLYNWITNPCSNTPINVKDKSDFFDSSYIIDYKGESYINSINKLIGYNYLYNYIYNLEICIKKLDNTFSFSNYNNIYELNKYSRSIQDIDLLVFIDWFLEEGILRMVDFIESLESISYKDEDMYNIMRYYNYLIENSIKNESNAMLTFLTEGSTEVFNKLNQYVTESVAFESVVFNYASNVTSRETITLDYSIDVQGLNLKNSLNIMMSAYDTQTSFL